jgi:hypothetical protein
MTNAPSENKNSTTVTRVAIKRAKTKEDGQTRIERAREMEGVTNEILKTCARESFTRSQTEKTTTNVMVFFLFNERRVFVHK